jgi:hypothetical protein
MTKEESLIILLLASPCNSASESTENENTVPEETYDLGDGTGDGLCEPDYDSGVYDPYPNDHSIYPLFHVSDAPTSWTGEDFEGYSHNSIIASANSGAAHIDVTSGTLYAKHLSGSQIWKRAWTDTHNFRMLAHGTYNQTRLRWKDGTNQVRAYFDSIHAQPAHYAGIHLFARYQTEYDLYVASLRLDGQIMIKKKHCGTYTTLAVAPFSQGEVLLDTWYELSFSIQGDTLSFSVDGTEELSTVDDTFSWGSMGVRIDDSDTYIDDWFITP